LVHSSVFALGLNHRELTLFLSLSVGDPLVTFSFSPLASFTSFFGFSLSENFSEFRTRDFNR
jgi:hypothetical protein